MFRNLLLSSLKIPCLLFLFSVVFAGASAAHANEPRWYQSGKETDSFFETDWKRDELAIEYQVWGRVWAEKSDQFLAEFNPAAPNKICEEQLLERWYRLIQSSVPEFTREKLISFVQFLRAQNLVDDLVYYVLKKSLPAWSASQGLFVPTAISDEKLDQLSPKERDVAIELRGERFCLSRSIRKWMPRAINDKVRRNRYVELRTQLETQAPGVVSWLDGYYEAGWDSSSLSLDLIRGYAVPGERARPPRNLVSQYINLGPSEYSSTKSPRDKKLSIRLEMHERLTPRHWVLIDEIWLKFIKRRDTQATRKEIITYADGTTETTVNEHGKPAEPFRVYTQQEKFEAALQDLNVDLNSNDILRKSGVDFSDAIMVGIEMGRIRPEDVDAFYELSLAWTQSETKTEKILKWVKRVGIPVISFAPPPWNMLSTFILAASDYFSKKNNRPLSARMRGVTR